MQTQQRIVSAHDPTGDLIWPAIIGPLAIWFVILYLLSRDWAAALGSITACALVAFTVAFLWKGRNRDWRGFSKVFFWIALFFPIFRSLPKPASLSPRVIGHTR